MVGTFESLIKEDMIVQVTELKSKIEEAKLEYNRLLEEALSLDLGLD